MTAHPQTKNASSSLLSTCRVTRRLKYSWDAASSAYDALHDKTPVIPEEMKANVGCFVIIGADGQPAVASGLYSDKPLERRKVRGGEAAEGAGFMGFNQRMLEAMRLLGQQMATS